MTRGQPPHKVGDLELSSRGVVPAIRPHARTQGRDRVLDALEGAALGAAPELGGFEPGTHLPCAGVWANELLRPVEADSAGVLEAQTLIEVLEERHPGSSAADAEASRAGLASLCMGPTLPCDRHLL
jgi:hypothetical protein